MPIKTLNRANVHIILSEYTSALAANASPLPYFRQEIRIGKGVVYEIHQQVDLDSNAP
jgi:hypothetical protein